jgi:hypothetical protein
MRNALDRYVTRHGKYPQISVPNGNDGQVSLSIAPGYVAITFHSSNHQVPPHTVYITRNAWVRLIRFALPLLRYQDRQFSVESAIRRYSRGEKELLRGLREAKRARA